MLERNQINRENSREKRAVRGRPEAGTPAGHEIFLFLFFGQYTGMFVLEILVSILEIYSGLYTGYLVRELMQKRQRN